MHALVASDLPPCIVNSVVNSIVKVGAKAAAQIRQPIFRRLICDLVRFPTACTPHDGESGHVTAYIVVALRG